MHHFACGVEVAKTRAGRGKLRHIEPGVKLLPPRRREQGEVAGATQWREHAGKRADAAAQPAALTHLTCNAGLLGQLSLNAPHDTARGKGRHGAKVREPHALLSHGVNVAEAVAHVHGPVALNT